MLYKVNLYFEDEYEIEADSEADAVSEAIDLAVRVGEWEHECEEIDDEDSDM
jgi:hypothetical protein